MMHGQKNIKLSSCQMGLFMVVASIVARWSYFKL